MRNLTLIFDLDGTLVHTAPDLVDAVNHALAGRGYPATSDELLTPVISRGATAMIETALKAQTGTADPVLTEELLPAMLAYYGDNIAKRSMPYPGVSIILERLYDMGYRLAVCTNKREGLAKKLLKELDLARHLHAIAGRDTLPVHKPDPGHLIGACILADGNPNRCIMVGDSEVDITAAKRAGIPVMGVSFGYSEAPIETFKPDAVIQGYGEFENAMTQLTRLL